MGSAALEFEKPIIELEKRIEELETFSRKAGVDLSGEYDLNGKLRLFASVENLTDEVYGAGGNNRYAVTFGAPLTVRMSYKFRF